jgi:penicillin-binding protein 2
MAVTERLPINVPFRVSLYRLVVTVLFLCIIIRLWYLQIVQGVIFRDRSENNRLQTVLIPPPRGVITDRDGGVLVSNRPSFNVEMVVEDSPNLSDTLERLAAIVGEEPESLIRRVRNQRRRRKFEPKLLLKDVSRNTVAKIASQMHILPGITIAVVPSREYLEGEFASHVIGYIREINQKQLESDRYANYFQGDIVGQFGIEYQMERYLQGARGLKRVVVNARGTRVGELSYERELRGNTVILTIEKEVQKAADEALTEQSGAIVALDPRNGEVLALASSPRFDPNRFVGHLDKEYLKGLDRGRAQQDRAVQGVYPPGSVFKIITAFAALSEKIVSPNDTVSCPGYYFFAGRRYGCWRKGGHGRVDLKNSIIRSCDVYYYIVGSKLGIDRIYRYASLTGLGRKTNIGLPDEAEGLVPSTLWKRRAHRRAEDKKWYPGETLSVSIGQGATSVTPIQVARSLASIVNGGKVFVPSLVRQVISSDNRILVDHREPEIEDKFEIDQSIYSLLIESLVGVVNTPGGTAGRAKLDPLLNIVVGGKTGTAQVAALKFGTEGKLNDHAWFAGFAPADKPEIVVVALAENGGHGGAVAAPIVQKVMTAYFSKRKGIVIPNPTEDKENKEISPQGH